MKVFKITQEVLETLINILNFAVKYKEIPGMMAKEAVDLITRHGNFEEIKKPEPKKKTSKNPSQENTGE